VSLWVLVLLVSSWSVWSCFVRFSVGFSFSAGCVLGVFLVQGLEKSLRLFGTLVVEDHVWFEDWWMVASLCDE
jgi:hypothetical protein